MFVPQAINEAPPTSLSDCCHCVFVSCDTDRRHNRAACVIVSVYLLTTFLATWMLHLRLCVWTYRPTMNVHQRLWLFFFVWLLFFCFFYYFWLSTRALYLNSSYLSFFFWLFVVATLTSVASTKVCGKKQKTKKKNHLPGLLCWMELRKSLAQKLT